MLLLESPAVRFAGLDLLQSLDARAREGFGNSLDSSAASVHCRWICCNRNRFQLWMRRGTEVRHMLDASEKIKPSAEASGIVLSARRKFAGWQGKPWPVSSMWKRKETTAMREVEEERL